MVWECRSVVWECGVGMLECGSESVGVVGGEVVRVGNLRSFIFL